MFDVMFQKPDEDPAAEGSIVSRARSIVSNHIFSIFMTMVIVLSALSLGLEAEHLIAGDGKLPELLIVSTHWQSSC